MSDPSDQAQLSDNNNNSVSDNRHNNIMKEENILVIITLVIFLGVYLPLSIYQIYRLYTLAYGKDPIESLQKRQTKLSLICCIAYLIQFIDLSLWSMVYTEWFSSSVEENLVFISQFCHLLMQLIITFFILLRFWLLHFSVKYEMIAANHHWKKIINPHYQIQERKPRFNGPYRTTMDSHSISNTEWIIANKHKWGNLSFLLKTVGIVFFIFFAAICAAQTLHTFYDSTAFQLIRTLSSMITYGIFLLNWSLLLAIYCRTPQFYDHIYVKKELAHLFYVMAGFFFVYIIFAVLFGFNENENDIYETNYFSRVILLFHCVALGNVIAIYVFTYLPLANLQKFELSGQKHNKQTKSMINLTLKKLSLNPADSGRNTQDAMIQHHSSILNLEDCLKNDYGFSAFMKV